MDNGKWIMDNEGVAFGDIFQIISEGNTTIIHYQLSIINYPFGYLPDKREFDFIENRKAVFLLRNPCLQMALKVL